MGREVRMVPKDWQHPKNGEGHYIPLLDGDFESDDKEWSDARAQWQVGLSKSYDKDGPPWKPIEEKYRHMRYTDYSGPRPNPDDYMPQWSDDQKTHYQMYETTSEGTPISPVCETPEELAHWLADNNASAFARMPATYEQWLATIKRGSAPSAFYSPSTGLVSGVAIS